MTMLMAVLAAQISINVYAQSGLDNPWDYSRVTAETKSFTDQTPSIGSRQDLDKVKVQDVQQFHSQTQSVFDFNDGNGPVPAHRHPNGGGWVADTAQVDAPAYVGPDARVYGAARVSAAWIFHNARVYDAANVSSRKGCKVWIFDQARVHGRANVACSRESIQIYQNAEISERARIEGGWVLGNGRVSGDATLRDESKVDGNGHVFDRAVLRYKVLVTDDAQVFGAANICGNLTIGQSARVIDPFVQDDDYRIKDFCTAHPIPN